MAPKRRPQDFADIRRQVAAARGNRRRLQKLVDKFGTLEGFMTQEELRRMREES